MEADWQIHQLTQRIKRVNFILWLKKKNGIGMSVRENIDGLMVSLLDPGARGILGWCHCVVVLHRTLHCLKFSLQPGVWMGTGKLSGKPDKMREGGERGEWWSNTFSQLMLQKPEWALLWSLGLAGLLNSLYFLGMKLNLNGTIRIICKIQSATLLWQQSTIY